MLSPKTKNKLTVRYKDEERENLRGGGFVIVVVDFLSLLSSCQVLGDLSERLQVASDDGVDEDAGLLLSVTRGYVNDVGLNDGGGAFIGGVERRHGSIVGEAVVPADD